jgi:hypothetical protein
MALSSTVLKALAAAGATTEMIIAAVEAAEVQAASEVMDRRKKDAERKRRSRAASTMSRGQAVTPRDNADSPLDKERSPEPPKENSTPLTPTPEAIASSVAPAGPKAVQAAFDEFWEAYPQRDGPNPRKPALAKFTARVRSGADPEAIIAAAGRYAAELRAKGRIGTPYVAQAVTWLNQDRFEDYAKPAAEPGASSKPTATTVTPGTAQWDAWYEFKRSNGTPTRLMDEAAANERPFPVPTEWPPATQATAA